MEPPSSAGFLKKTKLKCYVFILRKPQNQTSKQTKTLQRKNQTKTTPPNRQKQNQPNKKHKQRKSHKQQAPLFCSLSFHNFLLRETIYFVIKTCARVGKEEVTFHCTKADFFLFSSSFLSSYISHFFSYEWLQKIGNEFPQHLCYFLLNSLLSGTLPTSLFTLSLTSHSLPQLLSCLWSPKSKCTGGGKLLSVMPCWCTASLAHLVQELNCSICVVEIKIWSSLFGECIIGLEFVLRNHTFKIWRKIGYCAW